MNKQEQEYINSIPHDTFADTCRELWAADGHPLTGDMWAQVLEDYNNSAIETLLDDAHNTGQID
jgi:hypothetical protein